MDLFLESSEFNATDNFKKFHLAIIRPPFLLFQNVHAFLLAYSQQAPCIWQWTKKAVLLAREFWSEVLVHNGLKGLKHRELLSRRIFWHFRARHGKEEKRKVKKRNDSLLQWTVYYTKQPQKPTEVKQWFCALFSSSVSLSEQTVRSVEIR